MNQQPPEVRSDLSAQQRALKVYKALMEGPKRVVELQELVGTSQRGIYHILDNITSEGTLTNVGGYWYLLTTDEQRDVCRIVSMMEDELRAAQQNQAFAHSMKIKDVARVVALLKRLVYAPEPD